MDTGVIEADIEMTATEEAPAKIEKIRYADSGHAIEAGIIDGQGRITADTLPHYDATAHIRPKRNDFANEWDYLRWRAGELENQADSYIKRADLLRKQADTAQSQPDPRKRKALVKLQKMRETMAALEAQLAAEGLLETE